VAGQGRKSLTNHFPSDLWGEDSTFLTVTPTETVAWVRLKYALTRICSVEYIQAMESAFEIIAEPNRRAILSLLVSSQQSVGEIERQLRTPQPSVSKHLRVLREAGFVESTVDAQRRLYRLKPERFQEVEAWLAPFRRFWSAHVDALERHLDRMEQSTAAKGARPARRATPAKSKTRKRQRGANREHDSRSRDHDCS
jgi:DNA-binding transcriptional ArsR family regulator